MSGKTILVVDPDETVSNIIKKSFLGFDPTSSIMLFKDFIGVPLILDTTKLDCLITDSMCLIENGVDDFLSRYVDSQRIENLIITTYGEGYSKLSNSIKDKFTIISKPIDIQVFSEIVQKIVGPLQSEIVQQASLSSIQYSFCQQVLYKLKSSIGARCILLSDTVGRILVSAGDFSGYSPELITSLLGGGIATLLEAGKSLEDEGIIHLTFREGSRTDLYAVNVGRDILLIILIGKTQGYSRLGDYLVLRQTQRSSSCKLFTYHCIGS